MRFWQKTYIFTLVLFLTCLNAGVLSLTVYTNSKNIRSAEDTATAERQYIAMSFERDFTDMNDENLHGSPSLLMQSYGTYYQSKGLLLAFYEGDTLVYSNFAESVFVETDTIRHIRFSGKRHIVISSQVCDGKYVMVSAKNVEYLDIEFRSLMITYVATAAVVSLFLALCLYFILKKLSSPLDNLRVTTEAVEAGDFSVKASENGNDEFTLLAKSFNAMLAKINEQMTTLERESERKQMLVDNMAHEMRTPLTVIHGYAEFIEKANTTDEHRLIAARYIVSESERLQKISEMLLDGAFIRGNKIEMIDIDLAELLLDTSQRLRMRAEDVGCDIICDLSSAVVKGNRTLLSMLFYNLTENAIKACSTEGKVKLSCYENLAVIEDNGKGMTEEQLLHITEPFYRTDKSRSRAEGGAGLGLALCKQIALAHGADMRFESNIQKGTKISVVFTSRQ